MSKRALLWGLLGAVLAALLVNAFRPRPELVDLMILQPGTMQATVDAEGMTRVADVFTVSAPVGGRLQRTPLQAGDPLVKGETVVATIEPSDPAFLDPRAQAESREALQAAQAARESAAAELDRTEADQAFARAELVRVRELFEAGSVPRRSVEEAERAARAANAAVAAAAAALDAREHEVLRARARLFTPVDRGDLPQECQCVTLTSPVDGRVLRVFEKSQTVVAPGAPLLELGNPAELEVVADFLSADAVRIRPGQRAVIDDWGGGETLEAMVRHVEPVAFTKVSALGIEEQRVNVIFDLVSPPERWASLGHGYRVTARVVVWEGENVLAVPVTALSRQGADWYVFVAVDGHAERRIVTPGHRSGLRVQVVDGVRGGESVIVNPPASLEPGTAVSSRDR